MKLELRKMIVLATMVAGMLGIVGEGFGQAVGDYRSVGGNWGTLASWQRLNALPNTWAVPSAAQGYPGQNAVPGTVTILNNDDITLNVSPANNIGSLTIEGGNEDSELAFSGSNSLTVSGAITINAGIGTGMGGDDKIIAIGAGSLSCASLTIASTTDDAIDSEVTISTGTFTVSGNITMSGSSARNAIRFSDAGTLNLGGSISGGTVVASTGTVNYNGSSAQSVASYSYYNLTLSGAGAKTLGGDRAITGNFLIETGATLTLGGFDLDIDVNGDRSATINGTLNIDGNGRLSESQGGTKTLFIGPGGSINITNIGGTSLPIFDVYNFNPYSTVQYGSTDAQPVSSTPTYGNLVISGSGTKTFGGAISILGDLSISGAIANLGTFTSTATTLTLGGADQNTGSWGSTSSPATNQDNTYFSATTGIVNVGAGSQTFSSAGTFTFTVPPDVTSITVKAWGGGGGGGRSDNGNPDDSAGGGGGGGGGFRTGILTVMGGEDVTVVVGDGGAGATTDNSPGIAGENSSATHTNGTITANGGGGGGAGVNPSTGGSGGAAGSGSGGSGGNSGGMGAAGGTSDGGKGGGGAGDMNPGAAGIGRTGGGTGGANLGGNGGNGGLSSGSGTDGVTFGGGGGGTGDDAGGGDSGGDGANGQVLISWSACAKGIWLGTTSDWHNAANWCGDVPTASTDVVIPSGVTQPIIGAAAVCRNITIESGASLTITGSNTLAVSGNWSNSGTFTANSSTVTFNGGSAQTLGGLSSTTFYNLTINHTSTTGVTLANATTVANQLTLTDGRLILGNNDLTVSMSIPGGGSSGAYVQTNGSGCLTQPLAASDIKTFPVGRSAYNPAVLSLAAGSTTDNFCIRVEDTVFVNGISGVTYSNYVVDRTWFVSEGVSGGNNNAAALTVTWNSGESLGAFDPALCYVSHFYSGSWHGDTPGSSGIGPTFSRSRSGINNFSPFSVGSNSALPVTWLSFRATLNEDKDVDLHWSTASESNNEGFDVERSANARDWETIGFVPGAGTTSEVQTYQYIDEPPVTSHQSLIYYRLKQRDYDGAFEYSPVRTIELSNQNGIRVYPNPADEEVTISFAQPTELRGTARLYTQNNRLVAEYTIPPQTTDYPVRVAGLPAGIYVLQVVVGNEVWSKRLVIE